MATQEKLLKSLESVRNLTNNPTTDTSKKKEKVQHCNVITESICNPTIQIAQNFQQLLSFTIEVLLQLCDDGDADVRMIADECLNRIIRAMSNVNIIKIEIELHKELKKNGPARSLRAALWRFAQLSYFIRPYKGKTYVVNLMPCLLKIIERNDDQIHETLASSLPKIMANLGAFTTDNDVKDLLKAFFQNVAHQSPVIRRTTAIGISAVFLNCRKPYVFISYVLNNVLDMLIPVQDSHTTALILGVLGCLKIILPHINKTEKNHEIQGSFGTRHEINEIAFSNDRLLQIYELSLHYLTHSDHNVTNAALECLNVLLQNCPAQLKVALLNPNGITKSRISYFDVGKYKLRSPSVLSVATTLTSGDDNLELELTDSVQSDIEKWISESKLTVGSLPYDPKTKEDVVLSTNSTVESCNVGICDGFTESNKSESVLENLDKINLSETSSEKSDPALSPATTNIRDIEIGDFKDKDVSLIFCARFIAKHFLLTGSPTSLIPDKIVRVSVKSLALNCFSTILELYPQVLLKHLDKTRKTQQLCDVLLYATHSDPQLRGNIRTLIAFFVKAVFINNSGNYSSWIEKNMMVKNNEMFKMDHLIKILVKGLEDESSNCTRQTLVGLSVCLKYLVESESCVAVIPLLQELPLVAKNPYWLVKVKLLELLSEINYISIHHIVGNADFQNKIIHNVFFELLKDDDQRVRSACANAIVKAIPCLYYHQFKVKETTVSSKAIQYRDFYLSHLNEVNIEDYLNKTHFTNLMPFPFNEINKSCNERVEYTLSRITAKLTNYLLVSTSKHFMLGCIETLTQLSLIYPTTIYNKTWSCFQNITIPKPRRNLQTEKINITSSSGLFHMCVSLLNSSIIGYDLTCQQNLLKLSGNLFAAITVCNLKELSLENTNDLWDIFTDKSLGELCGALLTHVMRLLNIFHHVVDEIAPVLPQNKPVLGNLPAASSLSPIKRRKSDVEKGGKLVSPGKLVETPEKGEKKDAARATAMGYFANAPHYMKIYELLKSAYTNYKITLDAEACDKFLNLLKTTLTTLSQILEIATLTEIGRIVEEILNYTRSTFTLDSIATVECVQQLLKCVFGTNLTAHATDVHVRSADNEDSQEAGFYYNIYQKPYSELSELILALRNINKVDYDSDSTIMGYLHRKDSKKIAPFSKVSDKIIENYIRMFEPMVIKSLRQYTESSNVKLQCKVLQLLSQLVQLKVNYCLLDGDQIFIEFVLKQFEFIEKGQIPYPQELIPKIFEFLVRLSYGKQHSKSIISIPKIIQLCDGLMASGQNPLTHCIPALQPIVGDIFLARNTTNTQDFKELETTREVLLSMLLRLLEYPEVIDLLVLILNESKYCMDNTEKWLKWSKQVADAFLPALNENKVRLDGIEALLTIRKLIFVLNPSVFKPINEVLIMLFQKPPTNEDSLILTNRWLAKTTILFTIVSQIKEDILILKIMETQARFSLQSVFEHAPATSDPLNVVNTATYLEQLSPEVIFVRYIFRVIEIVSEKCLMVARNEDDDFVVEELSVFLMHCLNVFQSGSHCKMTNVAISLINGESTEADTIFIPLDLINANFSKLTYFYPTITFEWCYLLALLNYNDRKFWANVMQITDTYGILEQMHDTKIAPKTHCINLEISRIGGTIAFCDYLSENMADGEQLSWLLVNNIELLVNLCDEAPVFELISSVHRNSAASGLIIQAIATKCAENTDLIFKTRCLKTIENAHQNQSGALLTLLLPKFLNSKQLSLSRLAANLASRKIEFLLTMSMEDVTNQLTKDDLTKITESLIALKLVKKHETLISLLNKLSTQFYDLSPVELDQRRSVNPDYIKKLHINKTWYQTQISTKCRSASGGAEIAELLRHLEYDELVAVMSHRDFNPLLLKDCIEWACAEIKREGLQEEPVLLRASVECLLRIVVTLRSVFPKPHQVFRVFGREPTSSETKYSHKVSEIFKEDAFFNFFYHTIAPMTAYVSSLPNFPTIKIPDTSFEDIIKFAVVCLEFINHLIVNSEMNLNFIDCALDCANTIFKEVHLCSILALDTHISWLCSAVNSVYKLVNFLLLDGEPLPCLPKENLKSTLENLETLSAAHACYQASVLIEWLSKVNLKQVNIPKFLFKNIKSAIISLSRLPLVNSYVLIPPTAWKNGWLSDLSGTFNTQASPLPIDYLQEIDILEEFIFRIHLLGWINRQQFEETWMCLLSVLCYSPSETDLHEMATQATSLAVQAITSLLIQTIYFPMPNNRNVSKMLHVSRNREIRCESIALKRLGNVQAALRLKCNGLKNVFESANLEKVNEKYSYGQFSVEYLMLCAGIVEENEGKSKAEMVFRQRGKVLEESGLDVNSCLQFLLDLYSQWTKHESTPLRILHEVVRSLIIISDLFTERFQFQWMLNTCLELSRTHTIENEILHQYVIIGICKSAAVLTPESETYEAIKKLLMQYLKSTFLPARIGSLHGLLYLMQGCLLSNTAIGGISEEMQTLLPVAVEYIQCNISMNNSILKQTQEHTLLMWALAFYLIENIEEVHLETNFTDNVLQAALQQLLETDTTFSIHSAVLKGLERILIVNTNIFNRINKHVLNLALEKIKSANPNVALPGVQLLVSYMYMDCWEHLENTQESLQSNPDHLVQTVEKIAAIFDRIRKGHVFEVEVICSVLPYILNDFFTPSDILTKVIGEFLSTQQPHPKLLSKVVFKVFESAIKQSQLSLLQDWVVFSLSNFTQSLSVGMATWCLTCFFISASTNEWLRNFFPYVQSRVGRYEYEDRKMFCIAGMDFYHNLVTEKQKETFVGNFKAVKDQSDMPFSDLLASL